jgi:trimeric autotransporter adhesin
MNPLSHSKNTTVVPVLIALTLICFALSPQARAVCQEGCFINENTLLGDDVLLSNTGSDNTALGFETLFSNTSGGENTALGARAMISNSTGGFNTAIGFIALGSNTTGSDNTAIGWGALVSSTTTSGNTAIGSFALNGDTTGSGNTATGDVALSGTTTGSSNTANGFQALGNNTTGNTNTAVGLSALLFNSTGNDNTAVGANALFNTTGSNNIAVGSNAGINFTGDSNNIDIGNAGVAGDSKTIRIGATGTHTKTIIAGIFGTTVAGGVGVIVGSGGKLGTVVCSARFKEEIKPMDKASEAILALQPVTFRYKHELDPVGIPQFGLVAEDVEKVNPALVARDEQGKPYTVRYEAVNAMLLNEFLKEHRKVEQLTKDFESKLADQQKQIEALTTGLQKVSAQLELNKVSPQTVLNNR